MTTGFRDAGPETMVSSPFLQPEHCWKKAYQQRKFKKKHHWDVRNECPKWVGQWSYFLIRLGAAESRHLDWQAGVRKHYWKLKSVNFYQLKGFRTTVSQATQKQATRAWDVAQWMECLPSTKPTHRALGSVSRTWRNNSASTQEAGEEG